MNKKVNLMIIGSQKAGTTSLYEYLRQHPQVYFSEIKEITYFVINKYFKRGVEYFHSFFSNYTNQEIIASSYVHMLSSIDAADRVLEYNKDMKFIIMLREPVSRAFSAYSYAKQNGWEDDKMSFINTIEIESIRKKKNQIDLLYFYNGLYCMHIDNWMSRFSPSQFLIIKDSELRSNSNEVLNKITLFLNIKEYDFLTKKAFNVTTMPKFSFLNKIILTRNQRIRNIAGVVMPRRLKRWILEYLVPKLLNFNRSSVKFPDITDQERKIAARYFKNDLINLKKKYNLDFVK